MTHWLDRPHHDGSELFVDRATPRLGDVVPVRVRVPASRAERGVWVRMVRDGEPRLAPARLERADAHERWYVADVLVHNPVTSYRFLLDEPGGYRWLDGRGLHARDVTDAGDFRLTVHDPAPRWLDDAVVYQVFPDRFARSSGHQGPPPGPLPAWALPASWSDAPLGSGPGVAQQLYGGDLPGIEQRLDHLQRLGVDTLYLTPVFPARSNHRYDATSFAHVDPLLGGDAALASLGAALHARGMRLMGDLTTNHTGAGHEWFERALADRTSPEAELYYWTARGHVGWLEHASLPKLNHTAPGLAPRLVEGPGSVVAHYLRPPFSLDGWRIDVANMTGRYGADDRTHEVARAIRATMAQVNPDAALVSEHFHDAGGDLGIGGWHANMNYSAFTRPLWRWLVEPGSTLPFMGLPVAVPRDGGADVVATMRDFGSTVPWSVTRHQWNLLGSHDTARIRTVVGSRERVEVAVGLLATYPGTPVIWAGDEGGLTGTNGEHGRVPMPWDRIDGRDPHAPGAAWDEATFAVYRALLAVRRSSRALREGGLRWAFADDDAVGYLRETADERVLVVLARGAWGGRRLPLAVRGAESLYGGATLGLAPGEVVVAPTSGPSVQVWRLSVGA